MTKRTLKVGSYAACFLVAFTFSGRSGDSPAESLKIQLRISPVTLSLPAVVNASLTLSNAGAMPVEFRTGGETETFPFRFNFWLENGRPLSRRRPRAATNPPSRDPEMTNCSFRFSPGESKQFAYVLTNYRDSNEVQRPIPAGKYKVDAGFAVLPLAKGKQFTPFVLRSNKVKFEVE